MLSNPRPRDPGAADETPTGRGNLPRVSQESSHPRNVPGEAEVVPHEDDGVERPQPSWQPLHAPLVDFLDPADSGECHLGWRCVDPHHTMLFPLEIERVAARSATHVEDPAADFFHRLPLDLQPFRGRGEVRLDPGPAAVSVVSLELEDDLLAEPVVQHRTGVQIERRDRLAFAFRA